MLLKLICVYSCETKCVLVSCSDHCCVDSECVCAHLEILEVTTACTGKQCYTLCNTLNSRSNIDQCNAIIIFLL